jgi:hypothetical protein
MTAETSTGLPHHDVVVVRELAGRVAELAALPVQRERTLEWHALHRLERVRPMAMIDEIPWYELSAPGVLAADELRVASTDPVARDLETRLRRTLYRWAHMRVDMVVQPFMDVYKVVDHDGFGVGITEQTINQGEGNAIQSHHYSDQLAEPEDVEKLRAPHISLNAAATAERLAKTHELLDGILEVRDQGVDPWDFSCAFWDDIEQLRGTEPILIDFMDRPEHLHNIIRRYLEVKLAELDELERQGLLFYGLEQIHRTGGLTDRLPAPGFDPAHPRAVDTWMQGRAQLFVSTSDSVWSEFVPPYYAPYYARFGLGYFGCCDPLHNRVDGIRTIPKVVKISMSPWANVTKGAEAIGPDFVFSRKPNPAMVAMDAWVPAIAEQDFEDVIAATAASGCPVEFTLKDISTARSDPKRLWEWCEIAERKTRQ